MFVCARVDDGSVCVDEFRLLVESVGWELHRRACRDLRFHLAGIYLRTDILTASPWMRLLLLFSSFDQVYIFTSPIIVTYVFREGGLSGACCFG
jgi:hypothetical protein